MRNRSEPGINVGIYCAMDAFVADFFGILTHNLIESHVRDGSCHLDCYRASFYNDALLYMGKSARSRSER